MKKLSYLILKDKVFLIAFVLAIVTMFIIPPSKEYFGYINYKVLVVMFTIMLSVSGIFESHLFYFIATKLVMHFKNMRFISLSIVFTTFLLSMFLTNDAVLLTLIPFSIFIFKHINMEKHIIPIIVLQTIAANLGSALTPMGDPQNIYLFAHYQLNFSNFISMTLPISVIGGILVLTTTALIFPKQIVVLNIAAPTVNLKKLFIYLIILLNALLLILQIIPLVYAFLITLLLGLLFGRHLFKRVDWYLILTFVSFFIITGNLSQMTSIGNFFSKYLNSSNNVYLISVATSQIISNVPAAVLLSTFTDVTYVKALLQGVNVGAMGTLVASLASLISFKYILRDFPKMAKRYIFIYSCISIIYMVIITSIIFLIL